MTVAVTPTRGLVKLGQSSARVLPNTADEAFLSAEYSDLRIICGEKIFAAHKVIVCMRSQWFKSACGDNPNTSPGEIRLDDQDPILIERVLEFLYKSEYTINSVASDSCRPGAKEFHPIEDELGSRKRKRKSLDDTTQKHEKTAWPPLAHCPPCYFHARMFAVADYFMLNDLRTYAAKKFSEALAVCNRPWKLELIIRELWSDRTNYTPLKRLLLIRRESPNEKIHAVFLQLTPAFFQSVPRFAVEFCSHYISLRKTDPFRGQGKHVNYVVLD